MKHSKLKIQHAILDATRAPSVKYWMEPEWIAETRKCPITGAPNSFIHTGSFGTTSGSREKWQSHDISAFDAKGKLVGFIIATGKWGYSLGEKIRFLYWFRALGLQ